MTKQKTACFLAISIAASMTGTGAQGTPPAPAESVTIRSSSGVAIAAEFLDGGKGAPAVLFFPMCAATYMGGWRPVAERLQVLGISSLAVTYPGWGGSTGQPPPRGSQPYDARKYWTDVWGPDADAALAYLKSRLAQDVGIAAAGSSCGVHMALLTATRHRADVKAVVAFAGPHGDEHIKFLEATPTLPVLAVSAERDGSFPAGMRDLRSASAHPASDLILVPGAGHGTQLLPAMPELTERIAQWLHARLRTAPG